MTTSASTPEENNLKTDVMKINKVLLASSIMAAAAAPASAIIYRVELFGAVDAHSTTGWDSSIFNGQSVYVDYYIDTDRTSPKSGSNATRGIYWVSQADDNLSSFSVGNLSGYFIVGDLTIYNNHLPAGSNPQITDGFSIDELNLRATGGGLPGTGYYEANLYAFLFDYNDLNITSGTSLPVPEADISFFENRHISIGVRKTSTETLNISANITDYSVSVYTPSSIPEPGSAAALAGAACMAGALVRRRRRG